MYLYILYFKQRLSHSKIGLLEEHSRVKQAAPSHEGGGGGGAICPCSYSPPF